MRCTFNLSDNKNMKKVITGIATSYITDITEQQFPSYGFYQQLILKTEIFSLRITRFSANGRLLLCLYFPSNYYSKSIRKQEITHLFLSKTNLHGITFTYGICQTTKVGSMPFSGKKRHAYFFSGDNICTRHFMEREL